MRQTLFQWYDHYLGDGDKRRLVNLFAICSSIVTIAGGIFQFISRLFFSNSGSGSQSPTFDGGSIGLLEIGPIAIGLLLVLAILMGLGLGALISAVVRFLDEFGIFMGHILALIWMFTIVGLAYSLLESSKRIDFIPQDMFFATVAVCLTAMMARKNISQLIDRNSEAAIAEATGMLATFCGSAALMIAIQHLYR